jgi:alpha-1,6-mannosyltransferase
VTDRHTAVWFVVGLAGFVGLAVINWSAHVQPAGSPVLEWGQLQALQRILGVRVTQIGMLVAFLVAAAGWLGLRKASEPRVLRWAAVTWSVPLLFTPPLLSRDAYSYADLGWMVHQGLNPYVTGLGTSGSPAIGVGPDSVWYATVSPYPPGSLWLMHAAADLVGHAPFWSAVAMRLPALGSLIVLWWAVPRLTNRLGRPAGWGSWVVLANPLTLIHVVGGAHNDGPMLAVAALAMLAMVAVRSRSGLAGALLGLATVIKPTAVLLLPVLLVLVWHQRGDQHGRSPRRSLRAVALIGLGSAVAFFGAALVSGLGFGWLAGLTTPGGAATSAPSFLLRVLLDGRWPGGAAAYAQPATVAAAVAAFGVLALRWSWAPHRDLLGLLAVGLWLVVLASPSLRSWYLLVPLVATALARPTCGWRAWVAAASVASGVDLIVAELNLPRQSIPGLVLTSAGSGVVAGLLVALVICRWPWGCTDRAGVPTTGVGDR